MKRIIALSLFLVLGCATTGGHVKQVPTSDISKQTKVSTTGRPLNRQKIERDAASFEAILKQRPKNLTPTQWKLHDELLAAYIALKSKRPGSTIVTVPARTRKTVALSSFCLNHNLSSPSQKEKYHFVKASPGIPYFKEIIKLASNDEIQQADAQSLFWSLQSKTYWENYPPKYQQILKRLDPQAPLKLPSGLRNQVKNKLLDYVEDKIPHADEAKQALRYVEGKYYNYKDYAKTVNDLVSQYPEEVDDDTVTEVPDTDLYSDIDPQGYSHQDITFYNPTDTDAEIDLTEYYLQSSRADVQRIGMMTDYPASDSRLADRLERDLYDDMLRLGIGFTPVLGEVAGIYEVITGKDFVSGRGLSAGDRLLSGIGTLAGLGSGYRYATRLAYAPERMLPQFERGFESVAHRQLRAGASELSETRQVLRETERNVAAVERSPTLRSKFESPEFRKTDFYVRPNGDIVPAKGYRYIPADHPAIDGIRKTRTIPANENGNYLSFDKFKNGETATSKLQLPYKADADIRIEFDTKQMLDDVTIPRGKYGTSDFLEPLTKDFPDFGQGGATQATTKQSIKVDRVVDMSTGNEL